MKCVTYLARAALSLALLTLAGCAELAVARTPNPIIVAQAILP